MITYEQLCNLGMQRGVMDDSFKGDPDVHAIAEATAAWAKIYIDADDEYLGGINSCKEPFAEVKWQILAACNEYKHYQELYLANVTTVLNSIEAYGEGNSPETNLPLQSMLTRTWSLKDEYEDSVILVLQNLHANKEDQGGCIPGISVRLTQVYTSFVYASLCRQFIDGLPATNKELRSEVEASTMLRRRLPDEQESEEIALAMQEQLFLYNTGGLAAHATTQTLTTAFPEETDDQMALRLHCELNDEMPKAESSGQSSPKL